MVDSLENGFLPALTIVRGVSDVLFNLVCCSVEDETPCDIVMFWTRWRCRNGPAKPAGCFRSNGGDP